MWRQSWMKIWREIIVVFGSVCSVSTRQGIVDTWSNILNPNICLWHILVCIVTRPVLPRTHWASILLELIASRTNKVYILEVESHLQQENGIWYCLACSFSSNVKGNARQHVESKHVSASYLCPFCEHVAPSSKARHMHIKRKHK